jgi:hypothetical protein
MKHVAKPMQKYVTAMTTWLLESSTVHAHALTALGLEKGTTWLHIPPVL